MNKAVPHDSAKLHVTGAARYVDDIPIPAKTLHLAFGLSKGKPIEDCLELANKVAGLSTTKLGAGDAMPFLKDFKK